MYENTDINFEELGRNIADFCLANNLALEDVFSIFSDGKVKFDVLSDGTKGEWIKKIIDYCDYYNIPLAYLSETMSEPKVVPMIRGKAFEFSVMLILQNILPKNEWKVGKIIVNAQSGLHDVDVQVIHLPSKKKLTVECKLAGKERYRFRKGYNEIDVKCMRSRTLGAGKVASLAPKLGIPKDVLTIHNDQYLPEDFDLVITSIGNTFYRTEKVTGRFEWRPTEQEIKFLENLSYQKSTNLKDFAFNKIYVARSKDLAIGAVPGVVCTRKLCENNHNCGFIPNYPVIRYNPITYKPTETWVEIENSLYLFQSLIHEETSFEKIEKLGEPISSDAEDPTQNTMF